MQILMMMMKKKGCALRIKINVFDQRILFISSNWYIVWIDGYNIWIGLT